jgi:hypothetical protein
VAKIGELIQSGEFLDRLNREALSVASGDLEQGLWPDRSLEMDVKLDLR